MEGEEEPGTRSATGFQTPGQPDRTRQGLQYQSYSLDQGAIGVNGIARRVAPDYSRALFSRPPLSGGQMGNGNARSIAGDEGEM